MSKTTEIFVKEYFDAQNRAAIQGVGGGVVFSNEDKETLCIMMIQIKATSVLENRDIAALLATEENKPASYSKHYGRIVNWLKLYENGTFNKPKKESFHTPNSTSSMFLQEEAVTVKQKVEVDAVLVSNLRDSIKSVRRSGIRHGLSENDLSNIFQTTFTEVVQENKIKESDLKLKAFLRENKIEKEIAFQILESY